MTEQNITRTNIQAVCISLNSVDALLVAIYACIDAFPNGIGV
jgi:hypothetical protein